MPYAHRACEQWHIVHINGNPPYRHSDPTYKKRQLGGGGLRVSARGGVPSAGARIGYIRGKTNGTEKTEDLCWGWRAVGYNFQASQRPCNDPGGLYLPPNKNQTALNTTK